MIRTLTLAASAVFLAMPALACDGFEIHDAFVRTSTMMSNSGAAFMEMHNHGNADCHLVGARTDVSQVTELHTHVIDANGVARMMQVEDGFMIPAGESHLLQRGGDHVMLMGLPQPLTQGQMVTMTFVFEDGSEATAQVAVDNERMPGAMGGAMGGMGTMPRTTTGQDN